MSEYNVYLDYKTYDEYKIPEHLMEFRVVANNIERALVLVIDELQYDMSNKDDYSIIECSEEECRFSFGDADSGLDVCYIIQKF